MWHVIEQKQALTVKSPAKRRMEKGEKNAKVNKNDGLEYHWDHPC